MNPKPGITAVQLYGIINDILSSFSKGKTLEQFIEDFSIELV